MCEREECVEDRQLRDINLLLGVVSIMELISVWMPRSACVREPELVVSTAESKLM